jgi:hypothetical protein
MVGWQNEEVHMSSDNVFFKLIFCLFFSVLVISGCSTSKEDSNETFAGDNTTSHIESSKADENNGNEYPHIYSQAGYYDMEPIEFSFQQKGLPTLKLTSTRARIMYSFFPADSSPEKKPLFVIFTGGPGASTFSNIFSMNTSPFTLVSDLTGGEPFKPNPYSWTQMGNLLYIDAPNTGFSYNLTQNSSDILTRAGEFGAQNFNPFIDASQFVRVMLRFLNDHPVIQKNHVIIAGESYGGTRVSTMMNLILFYNSYNDGSRIYKDTSLAAEIEKHLEKTVPENSAKPYNPDLISKQFNGQILIEPQLTGRYQTEITGYLLEKKGSVMFRLASETGTKYCPCNEMTGLARTICNPYINALIYTYLNAKRDVYDVTKPYDHSDILDEFAARGLTQTDVLSAVLKYDAEKVDLLKPASRGEAYRYIHAGEISGGVDINSLVADNVYNFLPSRAKAWLTIKNEASNNDAIAPDYSLEKVFGGLKTWDEYFVSINMAVYLAFYYNKATVFKGYDINPESTVYGKMFLENLVFVKSLITDATNDLIIYSSSIPPSFSKYSDIVGNVDINNIPESDDKFVKITYKEGSLGNIPSPEFRTIYFPHYEYSGHSVSLAQPGKLLSDINRWMAGF